MQSGLVQGDAKATTDQQNVNNTHATLRGCLSSASLSIHDLSWCTQMGNSSVGTLFRAVFDSLVKKGTDLDLSERQNNLTENPILFLITPTLLNPNLTHSFSTNLTKRGLTILFSMTHCSFHKCHLLMLTKI